MASRRIQDFCHCGKPIQIIATYEFSDQLHLQHLVCGHTRIIEAHKAIAHSARNANFDRLLPFQKEFVEFAESNQCTVICRDEMGMGKTPESLVLYQQNAELFTDNYTKYCVIISPVGGIYQWKAEAEDWLGIFNPDKLEDLKLAPQVVSTSRQKLSPFALTVIIPWSRLSDPSIQKQLLDKGIGGIIVDECHFYKDVNSKRTQSLISLIKEMKRDAPKVFLSGTLVENRIMEMKVALNIVDPNYFYSWTVLDRMCLHSDGGKALTIAPWWKERFFKQTSRYMIGRKKVDVNIPLPPFQRFKEWANVTDFAANEEFVRAYNFTLDELDTLLNGARRDAASIIGLMQQLRHHTGRMKILSAAVWIESWLTLHPGEKLAVGIHHKVVREGLAALLKQWNPLQMSDEDPKVKDEIEEKFRTNGSRLLICSILSAGVGRNLQFCKNALVLERQWNQSKEEQFEQRFHRIIKDEDGRVKEYFTAADTVSIYTMNAANSFDEFFDEMIHLKGLIVDSSEENTEDLPDENFIYELAEMVVAKRMKWLGA
jgi:SNF2 family DNA or RNA helicase